MAYAETRIGLFLHFRPQLVRQTRQTRRGTRERTYDVLIHLDPDESTGLTFVAASKAKMKVANFSANRPQDFDILIPPQPKDSWKQRNHRIIEFIGDSPLT